MKIHYLNIEFPDGKDSRTQILAEPEDSGIVATGTLSDLSKKVAFLSCLFVKPEFRRRGIATLIVHCAKKLAKESGCEALSLTVNGGNITAELMYRKLGFRPSYTYDSGDQIFTIQL